MTRLPRSLLSFLLGTSTLVFAGTAAPPRATAAWIAGSGRCVATRGLDQLTDRLLDIALDTLFSGLGGGAGGCLGGFLGSLFSGIGRRSAARR
jgi:hypothetical protein